jgi:hypothetical protein
MGTTLAATDLSPVLARLAAAQRAYIARFPGDPGRRQAVHTVYGGAHLFKADTAQRLGQLAQRALADYAPDAATFAGALGLPAALGARVHERVTEKLAREPVEDFRIDFEDGYGNRPDAEEDGHAESAARELAAGMQAGTLPAFTGIRIKTLSEELAPRIPTRWPRSPTCSMRSSPGSRWRTGRFRSNS